MVKNKIELDIKVKCLEANITQRDLAQSIGTTGQYVNRVIKKGDIVNPTFVKMLESLGYDIELVYRNKEV